MKDKIVLNTLGKQIYKGSNKKNMDNQIKKMNELSEEKPYLTLYDVMIRVVGSANTQYFKRIELKGGLKK